jgi:macrolide-specific efflux system membrane fusion protein
MNKRGVIVIGAIGLIGVMMIGVRMKFARAPVPLRAVSPEKTDLSVTLLSTGTVQSENRLEIKPPTAGRLEDLLVREGVGVKKGQILGWMSSSERVSLLDAARAKGVGELERWKDLYRATPILSPLTGTLIAINAKPGQTITGSDVVFVVSDRLIIQSTVDETDIAQIKVGQEAQVSLDAYPKDFIHATVSRIAYDAKTVSNVTTYQVDLVPIDVPPFMKSGMTANVSFFIERRENAMTIPLTAVHREEDRTFVLVPSAAPKRDPQPQSIETGITDGKRVEVIAGLSLDSLVYLPNLVMPEEVAKSSNPFMPSMGRKGPKKGGTDGPH